MGFPVWEIPYVGGWLIVAVLSTFFAVAGFFAAGQGLFMVILERRAHRDGDQPLLSFLQDWSRLYMLVTVVGIAGVGTGLWMVTSLVEPRAAGVLHALFFWVWAMLWVLALMLVSSSLLYYSGWGATHPAGHAVLGRVMSVSAWLALFGVTGVLSFMLTPGQWLKTGAVADAFFNPSFNATLVVMAGTALGLSGLFSLVAACDADPLRLRVALVRTSSVFVITGFVLVPAGMAWQVAVIPEAARALAGGLTASSVALYAALALSLIITAITLTGPFNRPEGATRSMSLLLLLLGLTVTTAHGRLLESNRRPYLIPGYLYSNGIGVAEAARMNRTGFLYGALKAGAVIRKPGAELFRYQCMTCHTMDGHRAIRPLVEGWDARTVDAQLGRLERLRGSMPPFIGTARERWALATWLAEAGSRKEKRR
jgi:hypothetical protein